jgi:hypothetical protein
LVHHYPSAKVILTDRDPEEWYSSISRTILPASEIGRLEDPDPVNRDASEVIYRLVLEQIFENRLSDRDFAISKFLQHKAEILSEIDPNRLLVLQVGTGWEEICGFLNCNIPDVSFPIGNSVEEFIARKPYLNEHL